MYRYTTSVSGVISPRWYNTLVNMQSFLSCPRTFEVHRAIRDTSAYGEVAVNLVPHLVDASNAPNRSRWLV